MKEVGFAVIDQGQLELNTLKGFLSPFQRQSKEEGLGLGLTLVNRIAKKMGGRLEVKKQNQLLFVYGCQHLNQRKIMTKLLLVEDDKILQESIQECFKVGRL